jgi:two-component system sensor histidine kinase AgrC
MTFIIKLPLAKSVIAYGLYNIITGIGNAVTVAIFSMYNITYENAKHNMTITIYAHAIIYVVTIASIILIKAVKPVFQMPKEIKLKAYKSSIVHIIFVLVIISGNLSYHFSSFTIKNSSFIFNVFIVLCYFVFSIYNLNTNFKLESKSQELEYQMFYNKTLEALTTDLRKSKHNYNNTLAVISGYIQTKKWTELSAYMKEILNETSKGTALNMTFLNIKNAAILGLMTTKTQDAQDKGVDLKTVIEDEITEVNMKISELCEILGILFDNAIEAAASSDDKAVSITMKNSDGELRIIIENSVKEMPNINKIFEKDFSTKGEGRGLGLWITRNIVKKYKNVMLNTFVEGNIFKQELIIS